MKPRLIYRCAPPDNSGDVWAYVDIEQSGLRAPDGHCFQLPKGVDGGFVIGRVQV